MKQLAVVSVTFAIGAFAGYFVAGVRWGDEALTLIESSNLSQAQVLLDVVDMIDAGNVPQARLRMLAIAKAAADPLPPMPLGPYEAGLRRTLLAIPLDDFSAEEHMAAESKRRRLEVEAAITRICGTMESSSGRYDPVCRR